MAFRICVIGCGGMAMGIHGPSYAKYVATHADTELAACCDIVPERAEAMRQAFGFARCYTDPDAMLDAELPDAVCLLSPPECTCHLACRVLAKGCPLLTEKPPGLDLPEIDRMIAAADASGAPTQVAFNRRHTPLLLRFRDLTASSALHHIRYDFTRVGRTDPDFTTTAIHGIDTVRFLARADYAHIRLHYQPLAHLGPTVANVLLDCLLTSGATALLSFCPVTGDTVERATVHADEDTFYLHLPMSSAPDAAGSLRHVRRNAALLDTVCDVAAAGGAVFEANGFYGENAAFFDTVRAGRRPDGDLRDARQSVAVAQCIRERREEFCA